MAHHYIARFSNGTVLTRTSANRAYTHAYLTITRSNWGGEWHDYAHKGFSGSEQLARKASSIEATPGKREITFTEVVALEEVATRTLLKQATAKAAA